jgi:putative membrane protein
VLAPIDKLAMKQVTKNASAASVMIAVSPFALLDMLIVLWRNIRMMNQVSEIYGLQLGYWGRVKLIRKIFRTMVYAGATEILSDAGNYAFSAGITGKLSTRIAQGMGAGVLTARIGLKVINESRPLPWISQSKPGLSAVSKELLADLNKQIK